MGPALAAGAQHSWVGQSLVCDLTPLIHLVALTGIWREELLELVGNAVELLGISRRFAFDRDVRPN